MVLFKKMSLAKILAYSFLIGIFFVQFGCGVAPSAPKADIVAASGSGGSSSAAPPPPSSGSGSGSVVDAAGFFIKVTSPATGSNSVLHRAAIAGAALDYHTWLAGGSAPDATGFSSECTIPLGTAGASANYLCILEIEELELFFQPLTIQYHVPSTMCTYLRRRYYSFWDYLPGAGPATVSYDINEGGAIANQVNADANGTAVCAYDYTSLAVAGPNCCHGDYTKTVRTETSTDSTPGDGPWDVAISTESWGGFEGACVDGPLFSMAGVGRSSTTQLPTGANTLSFIEGTGVNSTYTLPAIINANINGTTRPVTNTAYLANFVGDPTGGTAPAGLTRTATTGSYTPSITYEFQCLNAAEELNARIALLIREWDENIIAEGANPDSGFGGVFEAPPYNDQLINDRYDWNDIQNDLGQDYVYN